MFVYELSGRGFESSCSHSSIDALDQIIRHYTTYRKTHRWPLAVLYDMLDISAYTTYLLFKIRPPAQGIDNSSRARFKFLCSFGDLL